MECLVNITIHFLQKMKQMGHEISYHYDVLDEACGDLAAAEERFQMYLSRFRSEGFSLNTVCQHGNPTKIREGYYSNRDFFRSAATQSLHGDLADIMVDFPQKANTEYLYFLIY